MLTPALIWLSGVVINIGLVIFVWILLRSRSRLPTQKSKLFKFLSFLPWLILLILGTYQAKWQMFGFLDPDFLRVQRGFDARGDLVGGRFNRGEILDRNGNTLAFDSESEDRVIRMYPLKNAGAHVVGYHHSIFGSTGLEKAFDSVLMGRKIRTPADFFRLLANGFVHQKMHGNPARSTLDSILQKKAYQLLDGFTGSIILIDPRSGSVLTMASQPSFNPELLDREYFNQLSHQNGCPFLNRSIQGRYAPGSTFKTLVSILALEHDIHLEITCGPNGFDCGSNEPALHDYEHEIFQNAGKRFPGHGRVDFDRAFAVSCNVYFAHLGQQLGAEKILQIARKAGFNQQIDAAGIGLISAPGRVPDIEHSYLARTVRLAIGQDQLLATPLHLAGIAAGIGLDGRIYKPRYLLAAKPEIWTNLTSNRIATDIARKMITVVENGTGKSARIPGVIVGGKTGTVENESGHSHAIFIGFAPWPVPSVAFSIVLEQAGTGGAKAAPIAAELLKTIDQIGYFEEKLDERIQIN